jgi:hypothetical protein
MLSLVTAGELMISKDIPDPHTFAGVDGAVSDGDRERGGDGYRERGREGVYGCSPLASPRYTPVKTALGALVVGTIGMPNCFPQLVTKMWFSGPIFFAGKLELSYFSFALMHVCCPALSSVTLQLRAESSMCVAGAGALVGSIEFFYPEGRERLSDATVTSLGPCSIVVWDVSELKVFVSV